MVGRASNTFFRPAQGVVSVLTMEMAIAVAVIMFAVRIIATTVSMAVSAENQESYQIRREAQRPNDEDKLGILDIWGGR